MNSRLILMLTFIFLTTLSASVLTEPIAVPIESEVVAAEDDTRDGVEEGSFEGLDAKEDNIPAAIKLYSVLRVVDGDTIVIDKDGTKETVRMIGLDTPETVHPSKSVQCFGKEASNKTSELLAGRSVFLEMDEGEGERDKYRRLLAYVFRDDGVFVNLLLIQQGYAYEYTYAAPYRYQSQFKAAETQAADEQKGLWADGVCYDL